MIYLCYYFPFRHIFSLSYKYQAFTQNLMGSIALKSLHTLFHGKDLLKFGVISLKSYTTQFFYGTITLTKKTCKKSPCYMRKSACKWRIVKKAKIFSSYVKHFWILAGVRNCRFLIGLCKQVFMKHLMIFPDRDNNTKLVPASFSYFLDFSWKNKV